MVSQSVNDSELVALNARARYYSPYPLTESEADELAVTPSTSSSQTHKTHGFHRVNPRSHQRMSDLLGGMGRVNANAGGELPTIWVCEMCFKYMAESNSYELHRVSPLISQHFSLILDDSLRNRAV